MQQRRSGTTRTCDNKNKCENASRVLSRLEKIKIIARSRSDTAGTRDNKSKCENSGRILLELVTINVNRRTHVRYYRNSRQ
ncbi:hypothetical protein TanjilG_02885 [Lupinus angustifolius]|uniref:Uncharacterized protein n=1 Tax=Lupinus angustifolius TaxID=3871 RepID=A0A4P1QNX5_LUPAN|nr:hypothetical protein TanjilG_02885 [Lupinus angustifolius]